MLSGWHLPVSPLFVWQTTHYISRSGCKVIVYLRKSFCVVSQIMKSGCSLWRGMRAMIVGAIAFLYRYMRGSQPGATASNYYGMTANSGLARWGSR